MTVLILYASCGSGHRRAAEAIANAAHQDGGTPARIIVRDILDLLPSWYARLYRAGYDAIVRRAPYLWGRLYAWTDRPARGDWRRRALVQADRLLAGQALKRAIAALAPDRIIATHFLPLELLSGSLSDDGPPLTCVVTDYRAHALWAIPGAELYAVASDGAARDLIAHGIPASRVVVTGIPVDPRFVGIASGRPGWQATPPSRILVLSGGGGVGMVLPVVRALDVAFEDLTITVSAGSNRALHERLRRETRHLRSPIQVIGLVDDIERLYADSDLLITKPGGLTTTEAAVSGLPMILIPGIPGQEEGNARHFAGEGAARLARTPDEVVEVMRTLRTSMPLRRQMLRGLRRTARPDAATTILALSRNRTVPWPAARAQET